MRTKEKLAALEEARKARLESAEFFEGLRRAREEREATLEAQVEQIMSSPQARGAQRYYSKMRDEILAIEDDRHHGNSGSRLRELVLHRFAFDLYRTAFGDPVAGNAFADWLDEQGESRAAALLREKFPYVDMCGNTTVPKENK